MGPSGSDPSPALMLKLAFSAYAYLQGHDREEGRRAVTGAFTKFRIPRTLGWLAVTGDRRGNSYSLVFAALSRQEGVNSYDVVVRGTNPLSLETWLREDFDVGFQVPWPGPPGAGKVSQATATALVLHEELRDQGEDLYSFLWDRINADAAAGVRSVVSFTGHSLGGLLAPVLALRFSELYPRFPTLEVNVFSFAAPTAGDRDFAAHLERSFTLGTRQNFRICRFYRCQDDVAVRAWNKHDMVGIFRLYPAQGVPINLFLVTVLAALRWQVRNLGYTQPFTGPQASPPIEAGPSEIFPSPPLDAEQFLEGDLLSHFQRAKALARRRPSLRVFRHTLAWLVQAVVMHVVPYANHLLEDEERKAISDAILRSILTHETFPLPPV